MRAALGGHEAICSHVIDLGLTFLHPADVVIQRYVLGGLTGMGGGKTQQASDLLAVAKVFRRAFFQHGAELFPEALILVRALLRQLGQHVQYPLGHGGADAFHGAVVLEDFTRHVQ